jgi:hypothetical protein
MNHTLPCDHVCDLDDRVNRCLGKDPFSTSAFNVKAEDTQRGNLCPFTLRRM